MKLEDLKDWFQGEDCLVVGCGPSAGQVYPKQYQDRWVIGCNRSVGYCFPDFGCCVEPRKDRRIWELMRSIPLFVVFAHICEHPTTGKKVHPRAVSMPNGSKDVLEWLDPGRAEEPLTLGMSPFFATAMALYVGFETVGLTGVDLPEDRWPQLVIEERAWGRLVGVAKSLDKRIINLSSISRLQAVPHGTFGEVRKK